MMLGILSDVDDDVDDEANKGYDGDDEDVTL